MTGSPQDRAVRSVGPYELWMLAHAAMGCVGVGGMMFLIPAFVLAEGGSPADAGAVMAVAGAVALAGPFIGSAADRFRLYRELQVLSLVAICAAALAFAFAQQELEWLVAASLLGLGMAGLAVVNATFVVGAGFDEETQARKLSLLQLSLPSGQVLGLATVAALTAADVDFRGRFLVLAAVAAVACVLVPLVNGPVADRIRSQPTENVGDNAAEGSLRSIWLSQFGLVILLVALVHIGAQAIESQYPNYMKSAFDIDPELSASALSVMVLISIPLYLIAGRWTGVSGPRRPFLVSAGARAAAGAGLLMIPSDAGAAALILFGVVMVVYPLFELNAATLAASTSPIGPGGGQGAVGAALALGTIIAAVGAGWVADQVGFSELAAITLTAAGAASVIGIMLLKEPRSG